MLGKAMITVGLILNNQKEHIFRHIFRKCEIPLSPFMEMEMQSFYMLSEVA